MLRFLPKLRVLAFVPLVLAGGGCSGLIDVAECLPDTASDTANLFKAYRTGFYVGGEKAAVSLAGFSYTVSDKRNDGWLMISGPGRGRCGTRGPAESYTARFRAAAEKYLRESGRQCAIVAGDIIADPFWEFQYSCARQP